MSEGDAGSGAAAGTGADGAVQRLAPLSGGRKQLGEWETGSQEGLGEGKRGRGNCVGDAGADWQKKVTRGMGERTGRAERIQWGTR